jgi:antitoxin ParD1/3/4
MSTMNISLPEALKAYVDEQVASGAYGTSSEYVRELIRKDMDARRLRDMLLEGAQSPQGGAADEEFFRKLRGRARQNETG